jgi:hypothetical protein
VALGFLFGGFVKYQHTIPAFLIIQATSLGTAILFSRMLSGYLWLLFCLLIIPNIVTYLTVTLKDQSDFIEIKFLGSTVLRLEKYQIEKVENIKIIELGLLSGLQIPFCWFDLSFKHIKTKDNVNIVLNRFTRSA